MRIYNESVKTSQLREPILRLTAADNDVIHLSIVDEGGKHIAHLLTFTGESVILCDAVYKTLKRKHYDTSFTKWDIHGSMLPIDQLTAFGKES